MDRVTQTFHLLRTAFIAALFLCASAIANANVAGQVIMVKGSATAISADGQERVLQRRSEINASDTIVTGSDSRVQIRFIDNALLALQEKSRLNIHEYSLAKSNGENEKVLMELVEGGFRTLTGSIGKGNREAYAVNTPVASIGVRGTLYSVHLNGGQLSAGVWQGGIVITTPNGRETNLGRDSAFSFGVFRNNNFRGLRTPPADLDAGDNNSDTEIGDEQDSAPNSDTDDNNDSDNSDSSGAPLTSNNNNSNSIDAAPNAFEQMDINNKNIFVQQAGADAGIVQNPAEGVLSQAEYNAYTASNRHGVMLVDGEAVAGKFVSIPNNNQTFFVVQNGSEYSVYRYSGNSSPVEWDSLLPFDGVIGHGIWGESGQPAVQFATSQGNSDLNTTVSWINSEIFKPSAQPSMDLLTIMASAESITDNQGREGYADMELNLDLRSGVVSSGYLYASLSSQNSTTYWQADFEGGIDLLTGLMNLTFTQGYFEFSTGSDPAEIGTFNTANSNLGGFLIGNQDELGFIGWFNLNGNLNGNTYSAGSYIFGTADPVLLSDPEIVDQIRNFNNLRASYAFIDNQVHIGAFIDENGKPSFVSIGTIDNSGRDNAVLVARSAAAFDFVGHGDNWGVWGETNKPVYIQNADRGGPGAPREIDTMQFADAVLFEFVPENNPGTYNFSTAGQQYFGVDSNNNALSNVNGTFQYAAFSGGISNGNLTLNYGNANTNATTWVIGFSGGYDNSGGLRFILTNTTATLSIGNSSSTVAADAYMEGFLTQGANAQDIKGALTALHLHDNNEIWANAVIQWGRQ